MPESWMEDNNPYDDTAAPGQEIVPDLGLDSMRSVAEPIMQHVEENPDHDDPDLVRIQILKILTGEKFTSHGLSIKARDPSARAKPGNRPGMSMLRFQVFSLRVL
ncbi:hypothetical protein FRC03_006620 [Tulasnella sp. 419]|nr:hypothetical protein FRC03_006620 [Tulasnella sp. 419]